MEFYCILISVTTGSLTYDQPPIIEKTHTYDLLAYTHCLYTQNIVLSNAECLVIYSELFSNVKLSCCERMYTSNTLNITTKTHTFLYTYMWYHRSLNAHIFKDVRLELPGSTKKHQLLECRNNNVKMYKG